MIERYEELVRENKRLKAQLESFRHSHYQTQAALARSAKRPQDIMPAVRDMALRIELLEHQAAERDRLLAESRANDQQAMAYLSAVRALVGGDDFPDMVRRCEKLRAECEKRQAAMIEAKSYIEHYMYGGSAYREPAAKAIALIDDAMQEANHDN